MYPNLEFVGIFQFISQLEDSGQSAVLAFILDMYNEGYIKQLAPGGDIAGHIYFYDEHFLLKIYSHHIDSLLAGSGDLENGPIS